MKNTNLDFQLFTYNRGLYDNDTKLTRFGARDYDPTIGRWTTKDPIGFAGGDTNLYAYVGGNPMSYVDPSGLLFENVLARVFNPKEQAAIGAAGTFVGIQLARVGLGLTATVGGRRRWCRRSTDWCWVGCDS